MIGLIVIKLKPFIKFLSSLDKPIFLIAILFFNCFSQLINISRFEIISLLPRRSPNFFGCLAHSSLGKVPRVLSN